MAPRKGAKRNQPPRAVKEPPKKRQRKETLDTQGQTEEKVAYKGNYVKQDLRRNGRKGVAVGTTERGKLARRNYTKSGRLKATYRSVEKLVSKVQETGRLSKKQALELRRKRGVADKCLHNFTEPLLAQVFSPGVTDGLVSSLQELDGLGEIAESRLPDCPQAVSSEPAASATVSMSLPSSLMGKELKEYTAQDLELVLREVFGHESFRPGQQQAIANVLASRKTLLLLATGCGKSLCYQLPAFLLREEGLTLVISPLVSLMSDQLLRLPKCLRGAVLSGQQSRDQMRSVMRAVRARMVDVLFISPERLSMWAFDGCGLPPIALACVDEAHCVSEWSHNFRPDYLRLHEHLVSLGARRVLALTATATRPTVESVHNILQLESIVRADRSFSLEELLAESSQPRVQRANLAMDVRHIEEDEEQFGSLVKVLQAEDVQDKPAIVYVWKRMVADNLAKRLRSRIRGGVSAYHGSLAPEARSAVQDSFMAGRTRVVVATMAFGMGLDKPDIRIVVHYNLPKSIENYIQETGRCSRDGGPGRCMAFVNSSDFKAVRWMESGGGGATTHRGVVRKLLAMIFKKEGKVCERFELDSHDDTPVKPYHIAFDEHEASRALACPLDELHSVLVHMGYRAAEYLTLYSRFPTKLKLRFFKSDPKELEEADPFLRRILPMAKVVSGVHTLQTAKVLASLGGQPGQLANALWAARGDEFSVEKSGFGFMVAVHKQPSEEQLEAWAADISEVNTRARSNSVDKVDAVYMALIRAAEASRSGSSEDAAAADVLNELIDAYFAATKDPSAVVAGGDEHRTRRLQAALGSTARAPQSETGTRAASQLEAATPSAALAKNKEAVYMTVTRIMVRPDWQVVMSQDLHAVAHAVAQYLAGIRSVAMPSPQGARHPCWAQFKHIGDFTVLEELVVDAFQRQMKTGETVWERLMKLRKPATTSK
mmetsp:Transcript_46468/g.108233  ORF Transcript_46468/g.108233 Transcript_46468/m.108233 type:complete len:942 (-) Transcript_46468:115-2940(-)